MNEVIGEILPLAIGVAISPMPIIAVILMLLAPRAAATAAAFLVGWVAGIVVVATAVTLIAANSGLSSGGSGSSASATLKIIVGVLLLVLAWRQWRSRPRPGQEPATPGWLKAIDSLTPAKAAGLGFLLSAINPKNLLMILGAGVVIGQANLPAGQTAVVIAIFTVLAACTVAVPVIVFAASRAKATVWLTDLKAWLIAHNAAVMTVLLLIIGVVLIGKGLAAR